LKLAGLTYRQLHDWEQRAGIIETERAAAESWRKFTSEEVIALPICARLREHFALPLKNIGGIYKWLLGKKTDEVQERLAAVAEINLEELKWNSKFVELISGREEDFSEKLLKDEDLRYLIKKFYDWSINMHSRRPIICALMMAQLGMPSYLLIE